MDGTIIYLLAFLTGSLYFVYEGFMLACEKNRKTPSLERFSWFKSGKTLVGALIGCALVALAAPQTVSFDWASAGLLFALASSGYTTALLQRKGERLAPDDFFEIDEPGKP